MAMKLVEYGFRYEPLIMNENERRILSQILPRTGNLVTAEPRHPAPDPVTEFIAAGRSSFARHRVAAAASLTEYCKSAGIRRIDLLDLGPCAGDVRLMRSGIDMIRAGRIDILRFDYHHHIHKRGESIADVYSFLTPLGFTFIRIDDTSASHLPELQAPKEAWSPTVYLAFSPRLRKLILSERVSAKDESLIDIEAQFSRNRLAPRGVIHVGAHHGEELPLYKRMGFRPILFVEANPDLADALRRKTAGDPDVIVVNCAVSDTDGQATLRITSNDLSSSILPLKLHRQIYPSIDETRQVTVPARRIVTLLAELNLSPNSFNFLHLDIQGAEFMALKGAAETLPHIQAIVTEVNFEELYAGCGLFDDLDDFLTAQGFKPQVVTCPFHSSWGDAFYARPIPLAHAKPAGVISMASFGRNGRYGNQLFQFAFLSILARHHNLEVLTPNWAGQQIFGIHNGTVPERFPRINEGIEFQESVFPNYLFDKSPAGHDIWGFLQFDTVHLAPYKDFIRNLYKPVPRIENPLRAVVLRATENGTRPLVALHLRRGDFNRAQFFAAPSGWYRDILDQLWPKLKNPLLYICSDELPKVLPDFAAFSPITQKDLGVNCRGAEFYTDFYVMTQADVLGISNSSFSFFAGLLNERCRHFFRPHLFQQRLVPYDPWNTPPVLHRELGEPLAKLLARLIAQHPESVQSPPGPKDIQVLGKTPHGSPVITFSPRPDNTGPKS